MLAEQRYRNDPELLKLAAEEFGIDRDFKPFGNGHINDTYFSDDGKYVLQRINTEVFRDPEALMENIRLVTDYLRRKSLVLGEDPERSVLCFLRTKNNALYTIKDGLCFRMMNYIRGSCVIEPGEADPESLLECGRGFGRFQKKLADMDASLLTETIPSFHDTPKRIADLWKAAEEDPFGRTSSVGRELDLVRCFENRAGAITEGLCNGSIPLCVTHNDTKINNILFDRETKKALCVIDLDTVMQGSRLYDYGDALRTAAAAAAEDETDEGKIGVDLEAFRTFTKGFLEETGDMLSQRERSLLPFSFLLMTLECGIRFLEDHLRGDVYFKTKRPFHNLERARNQFIMAEKIDAMLPELTEIILGLGG